jgi:hypothetical protein
MKKARKMRKGFRDTDFEPLKALGGEMKGQFKWERVKNLKGSDEGREVRGNKLASNVVFSDNDKVLDLIPLQK